jgi:MrcB-like, N-terminal domain
MAARQVYAGGHRFQSVTAQHGMYVVYLFAADMKTVALSLNQGVTEIGNRLGRRAARRALQAQAAAIRSQFTADAIADLDDTIDLRSSAALPVDYEYGHIVGRTYAIEALPDEAAMVTDLQRFVRLYALALEARAEGQFERAAAIVTPPGSDGNRKAGWVQTQERRRVPTGNTGPRGPGAAAVLPTLSLRAD